MLKLGEKGAIPQRDNETYAIAPHIPMWVGDTGTVATNRGYSRKV